MLLSLLLPLTASSSSPVLSPLGRPFNAWFLEQVTLSNPALASTLHDDQGVKPYTVSTLLDDRGLPIRPGSWLSPGQVSWLRITTFSEQLSDLLVRQIIPRLPERLIIYKMTFRLDGWTLESGQHPWAGQSSFQAIGENLPSSKQDRLRLEFTSPTAFRSEGVDIPLPIPGLVFRSLWQRWNAFCPQAMQVQDLWPGFASASILVNELTAVSTHHWKFAEGTRGAATGFTGTVGYQLATPRQSGQWAEFRPGADKVLQSLACFAFYCGVGHHTTIGMGQTRLAGNIPRKSN